MDGLDGMDEVDKDEAPGLETAAVGLGAGVGLEGSGAALRAQPGRKTDTTIARKIKRQ